MLRSASGASSWRCLRLPSPPARWSSGMVQRHPGWGAHDRLPHRRRPGEPSLNLMDLLQTDGAGYGAVNPLAADQLVLSPKLYATVILWLLSQLLSSSNDIRASPTASSPIPALAIRRHGSAAWAVPSLAGCPPLWSRRGARRDLCRGQRPPAGGG